MKKLLMMFGLMGMVVATPLFTPVTHAQISSGIDAATTTEMQGKTIDGSGGVVQTIVSVLLWVVGILSVIMIIWSGISYIMSSGDANKVTKAKNTLIYSVVGLILAILAAAIVNFVIKQV